MRINSQVIRTSGGELQALLRVLQWICFSLMNTFLNTFLNAHRSENKLTFSFSRCLHPYQQMSNIITQAIHSSGVSSKQPRKLVAYSWELFKDPIYTHLVVNDSSLLITLPSNHLSYWKHYTKSKSREKFIYFRIEYPVEYLFLCEKEVQLSILKVGYLFWNDTWMNTSVSLMLCFWRLNCMLIAIKFILDAIRWTLECFFLPT